MGYHGGVTMSKVEQLHYVTIERYRRGELIRIEADPKINLSERQVIRIVKKVREKGITGIKHGNSGQVSWNNLDQTLIDQFVQLYKDRYLRFNYSPAYEMIQAQNGLSGVSYDSFRKVSVKKVLEKVRKHVLSR